MLCFHAGMSTVHEVVTAKHCGLKCLAFSLITNTCATNVTPTTDDNVEEEVMTVAQASEPMLRDFVFNLVQKLAQED